MSSKVILDNISFSNNPANFQDHIELEITFSAIDIIPDLLQWKVIYVGSAKDQIYDQVLEEFEIGPILEESTMKFTVDCPPPDFEKIPRDQLICVTALIITVSYRRQEFIRIGYYVHNLLTQDFSQEQRATASPQDLVNATRRTILVDKPRITKFRINWNNEAMKEQTNNQLKLQQTPNSNSSLLGRKMRHNNEGHSADQRQSSRQQKSSTREQKSLNSQSLLNNQQILHMKAQ